MQPAAVVDSSRSRAEHTISEDLVGSGTPPNGHRRGAVGAAARRRHERAVSRLGPISPDE